VAKRKWQPGRPASRPGQRPLAPPSDRGHGPGPAGAGGYWIYGRHAVEAALANPARRIRRLAVAAGDGPPGELAPLLERRAREAGIAVESLDRAVLSRLLPSEAVHQGVAARVEPLAETDLGDLIDALAGPEPATLLVLDRITDPHNVGAILRSAAVFGATAVILTERHAAPESGSLAKAASGALEYVPLIRVGNLARALEAIKEGGFWTVGLAAEAERTLAEVAPSGRVALVLGAEGEGLRRLTRERCDLLARLPTAGPIAHLNVSNAAAVGLYEIARAKPAPIAPA
jgi:23S rRNA (guanosine2251-2'-O)-methyltransferase